MSTTTEAATDIPVDLIERAMALSAAAKERLGFMMLDAAQGPPDDPELVRKETHELIKDRLEGFLSGKYQAVDAKESIAKLKQWYRETYPQ